MPLTPKQQVVALHCFLFEGLEAGAAEAFLKKFSPVLFERGGEIYSMHNYRRSVGLILSGEVCVKKGEGVLLNTLGSGDCFGVAALFNNASEYVTTIEAKSPAQILFFPDEELRALFEEFPGAAINYISFLSEKIRFLNHKIDGFTAPSTQACLVFWLLERQQEGVVVLPGGYAQLARQLGIGRASLYRCLEHLEAQGLLRRESKEILLLQERGLRELLPIR